MCASGMACAFWLFGSYVRGEERPRSDLDVLVELGDKPIGLFKYIKLESFLSEKLGVKIDLVDKQGLKPALGQQILREAVVV